jgi:signal transduction histidine kinase
MIANMANDVEDVGRTADPVPLQPLRAFAFGFGIWSIPYVARFLIGTMSARQLAYAEFALTSYIATSLLAIWLVYRAATRRGLGLQPACALSLAASVPALMMSWLLDFALTKADPSLSATAPEGVSLRQALLLSLADSISIVSLLATIVFLPVFAAAHQQRSHEVVDLAREADRLRYRANLEPHFVLNSLNAVAGLVEEDPPQARELLAALGDLFRDAASFHAVHPVRSELAWLQRYVTIHALRYPDKLRPEWDVDPATRALMMPALLLQPLVENAVKHGALRGGGHLLVRSRVVEGQLELSVEDDGPQIGAPRKGGRGLAIVRRRLKLEGLGPESFELGRHENITVARIRIPLVRGEDHG